MLTSDKVQCSTDDDRERKGYLCDSACCADAAREFRWVGGEILINKLILLDISRGEISLIPTSHFAMRDRHHSRSLFWFCRRANSANMTKFNEYQNTDNMHVQSYL